MTKNKKNVVWVIEFNETIHESGINVDSMEGKKVTKPLLNKIKKIDETLYLKEDFPYLKFYFDRVENGETTDHIRVDIGDGVEENKKFYDYVETEI